MSRARFFSSLCPILLLLAAAPVSAADLFVAPAAPGVTGDGSKSSPFSDPWRALANASSGDSIHVAEGTYYGRFDRGNWTIDRPNLTILGGYSRDFSERNPWAHPAVLAYYRSYEGPSESNLLTGLGDHHGLVLDGMTLDGAGRNRYDAKPPYALEGGQKMVSALAAFLSSDITVRNCIFLNSSTGGVSFNDDNARFENNLVINCVGSPALALREANRSTRRPDQVKNNTFAFLHDETDPPMGKGGENGVGIRVSTTALIENNLFLACGNAGINVYTKPADLEIVRNVFALNMRADIAARVDGREMVINDKNLDEAEDLGFKTAKDNKSADSGLTGLPKDWIAGVTRHILFSYATPNKDGLAKLRTSFGLSEPEKPSNDQDRGPLAPLLDPKDAGGLRVSTDAGAHPADLKVAFSTASAAGQSPARYTRTTWDDLAAGKVAEGTPVEFVAGIGNENNGFLLSNLSTEKYLGFYIYYPGDMDMFHVYTLRNGLTHRQWENAAKSNDARGIEDWFLIRGIAHLTGVHQKTTIEVQSITPTDAPPAKSAPRPAGKEWFVKAGASGGDGSRDKPFRDPFQALEKAADGDTIRIAGGDYFGKLRIGTWKTTQKYLSLLGGYSADFASRDPWKNPTRLVLPADADKEAKSSHGGTFLKTEEVANGLVLDGLVFDGSTVNSYFDPDKGGALSPATSPVSPLVQLMGPDITVRNCTFVNASGLAADLSGALGTFENNVLLNTSGFALKINAMGPGPWRISHNTFLFTADPTQRSGTGHSSLGSHLLFSGRAAVAITDNIFAFADNYAMIVTTAREKVRLDRNVFAANLYCDLSDSQRLWVYDGVFERRLADAGFVGAAGNVLALPGTLPVDKAYADSALARLVEIKSRYDGDRWTAFAKAIGATVKADAATTAPAAEPEKKEEKKEASIDDLMRELNAIKSESNKPAESAPKGPAFCPTYPSKSALELFRDGDSTEGARHISTNP